MKKIIACILFITMAVLFAGCGAKDKFEKAGPAPEITQATEDTATTT